MKLYGNNEGRIWLCGLPEAMASALAEAITCGGWDCQSVGDAAHLGDLAGSPSLIITSVPVPEGVAMFRAATPDFLLAGVSGLSAGSASDCGLRPDVVLPLRLTKTEVLDLCERAMQRALADDPRLPLPAMGKPRRAGPGMHYFRESWFLLLLALLLLCIALTLLLI